MMLMNIVFLLCLIVSLICIVLWFVFEWNISPKFDKLKRWLYDLNNRNIQKSTTPP